MRTPAIRVWRCRLAQLGPISRAKPSEPLADPATRLRPWRRGPSIRGVTGAVLLCTAAVFSASVSAQAPGLPASAPSAPVRPPDGPDGATVRLPPGRQNNGQVAPVRTPCPTGLPAQTLCLSGTDLLGAGYWLVKPPDWNGTLVVHVHGGPELGAPKLSRTEDDLKRWSVFVRAGYAWAASTFRQGGVEVRAAGEDSERARQAFITEIGAPQRTLLHGQSWGAGVAARMAERYTAPDFHPRAGGTGRKPYDAVLLTSGVLGGAPRSYDLRLDLRVVYQALCNNHPRPDEPAHPLWMGLPLPQGSDPRTSALDAPAQHSLTRDELARRVDECTGIKRPSAERSPTQRSNLATLLGVLRIPESSLLGHMNWATWHFHDIVWRKLKGRNPFGNEGVVYSGSPGGAADDAALNARVQRFQAEPAALAELAADTNPTGLIHLPVLTMHGIDDPVAFVELEDTFRSTMTEAGTAANLLQVYTRDREHSYSSDAQYVAAAAALLQWAETGKKPTPADIALRCSALESRWDPAKGCRFQVDYTPAPLATRVPERQRKSEALGSTR